ncbi:MAG: hypothetical protein Q4A37_02755 [Candidatus Saccharibacteria bacterium]|nr:hypothetical protein [Candidatus Saccharibacteria bacterium]
MPADKDVTIRKRQQIDSSKKMMFISVAVAAFVLGICLVVSFFLAKQIIFHTKVIGEKQATIGTLNNNIANVKELEKNVRALEAHDGLNIVKVSERGNALQSVLDALPTEANADALGASLQRNFVGAVGGLTLESLTVDAVGEDGDEAADGSINFSLTVIGSPDKMKELLLRFERSIRVIDITSAELQAGENSLSLIIRGKAYYEPAQTVELETKVVKP